MSLALLLALLAAVLAFGPLLLLWWLPERSSRGTNGRDPQHKLGGPMP